MDDNIKAALRGDAEAAAECTAAGVAINCPWCNGMPEYVRSKPHESHGYRCGTYGCIGRDMEPCYITKREALAAWNQRVKWEE